ncbi:MAG: short-chain dehydrogenase, partial [Phenylobacterium sp.]|nr:short-chain dehydrogenase [Phenylobacterium sp.]
LQTEGFQPGRPYTAQEVAENASKVFFADTTERTAVSA